MGLFTFLQHLINGVSLGSLYALIAIGYTMVYGILRLINFAHGEIFMIGAYFAFYLLSLTLLPWWVAVSVAIGLTCMLGIGVERVAYRPLRSHPRISIMISAIGVSFFLQNLGVVLFGGRPKAFPVPELFSKVVNMGEITVVSVSFVIPIITAAALVVLLFLVEKTKIGTAMRALSTDFEAAALMGIDVNRVISFTFGVGSSMAALGGIMWAFKYPNLIPFMGVMPGLKCFIAAVVGGIGSIKGAVLGGFILGVTEILLVALFPGASGYRDAFAFIILILILLLKPQGLFSKGAMVEKV